MPITDREFATLGQPSSPWEVQAHADALIVASRDVADPAHPAARLHVSGVLGTNWHAEFRYRPVALQCGRTYRLSFQARSSPPASADVWVGQAEAPHRNLGLSARLDLEVAPRDFVFSFTATADEARGRINFPLGRVAADIWISAVELSEQA